MLRHNWNEASAPPLQMSCNISHFPEAFPQTRSPSFLSDCLVASRRYPAITAFAAAATLVAATAIVNRQFAKKAQRDNPPRGRFIGVDGVRLHYVERAMAGRWFSFTAMAA